MPQFTTPSCICCGLVPRPGRELPGIQDAVLRTAERILGDESPEDGTIQLPQKCHLRMLLFKYQIGMVMGRRGSTINEMRSKSSATIKLMSPANSVPVVPCALPDDEMIVVRTHLPTPVRPWLDCCCRGCHVLTMLHHLCHTHRHRLSGTIYSTHQCDPSSGLLHSQPGLKHLFALPCRLLARPTRP